MKRATRATRRYGNAIKASGVAIVATLVVGGCADSATTSGDSPAVGGAAQAEAVEAAQARVEERTAEQPEITVPPLDARPPAGLTVGILTCPVPSCQATTNAAAEAAEALGWTVTEYVTEISPEAYQSTWNRMLQSPPDLIVYIGLLPNETIASQLDTVRRLGIPTVSVATSDAPDDVMRAVVAGPAQGTAIGALMGDAVVADAQGDANAVFVWDPAQAHVFGAVRNAFEDSVTAAGGSVEILPVSIADVGRAGPGQITSYLQAHPDVEYVAFMVADFVVGVPQALEAAGLSDVKLLSRVPTAANLENLRNGDEWLEVAEENAALGYRCIDTLARILEGSEFEEAPVGWYQILTEDNVTQTEAALSTPGSPEAFLAAWHVG